MSWLREHSFTTSDQRSLTSLSGVASLRAIGRDLGPFWGCASPSIGKGIHVTSPEISTPEPARGINRRTVLKASLAVPAAAAVLSACSTTPAASSSPSAAAASAATSAGTVTSFKGVTLQIGTNPSDEPALKEYAAGWEALTGGKAVVTVVPYAERAIKFAGFVATQDGSMDLLYGDPAFTHRFGDRLFMDLNGKLDTSGLLSSVVDSLTVNGQLLSGPLSSDMYFMVYNKAMFAAAGADPEAIPSSFDGLYALAPKLHVGDNFGCLLPWLAGYARTYWVAMYNGGGEPMFNEDSTQVLFNNASGLAVFESIKKGLETQFYDPNVLSVPGADFDTSILFNQGKGGSQIGTSQYWSLAYKGPDSLLKPEDVGACKIPAVVEGKFGTTNAFEGVGVNKYTANPDAAVSFLSYMTSFDGQKAMMLTGESGLPAVRSDVLNDPEVAKIFPIGSVLAEQGTLPSNTWPTPYDTYPVFDAAVNAIARGGQSAQQALDIAVSSCNELITKYLTS